MVSPDGGQLQTIIPVRSYSAYQLIQMALHRRCDHNSPDCLSVSLFPHYMNHSLLTRPVASSSFPMSPLVKSLASLQKASKPSPANVSTALQRPLKQSSATASSNESSHAGIGTSSCFNGLSWTRTLRLTQRPSLCTSKRTAIFTLSSGSILFRLLLRLLVLCRLCYRACLTQQSQQHDRGQLGLQSYRYGLGGV